MKSKLKDFLDTVFLYFILISIGAGDVWVIYLISPHKHFFSTFFYTMLFSFTYSNKATGVLFLYAILLVILVADLFFMALPVLVLFGAKGKNQKDKTH